MASAQDISPKQGRQIDSLNAIIKAPSIADTTYINSLHALVRYYYLTNPDRAIELCYQSEKRLLTIKNKKGSATCFAWLGYLFKSKGEISKALEYYDKSLKTYEELGDKKEIAGLLISIGNIYYGKGEISKALEYFDKSLNIYQEQGNKDGIARSLNNIGNIYYGKGEISKALEYYDKSLKIFEELGDKKEIAGRLINIGSIYYDHGEITKALEYFDKSLKIFEELGDKEGIAISLGKIGSIYHEHGEIRIALEYYAKSLKIFEERGNQSAIAGSLNTLGSIYHDQGEISKALEYYDKSLKIFEELGHKSGVASSLNNIGLIYDGQGEITKALEYYDKSLKIREELGNRSGIANTLNNIGSIYYGQGEITKALEYYDKSLRIFEELGVKKGIAGRLSNIGNIYSSQGEITKALEYYDKSLKIEEELGNRSGIATSLISIGITYYDKGAMALAQNHAKQSMALACELGYPDVIKHAANLLYKVYTKTGNYKRALNSYELFIEMRDSINNEHTQKAAIKQNMQYEYEKQHLSDSLETSKELALKDIEISKQQAEAKAERTTKYGLFGGLSLVLLIAFVLYRSVQQKKKANDKISYQKQEVEHKNKEILDSITYAERIQSAILPPMGLMNEKLGNGFVLYKPKDIVAGDFYWLETTIEKEEEVVYFSAADCTGHGVPGAMMSVMCSNALTKSVKELGLTKPGEILDATTKIIEGRFERSEQMVLDGMDLALCKLNLKTMKLEYAGANNPLWIIRNGEVLETKADKQPIGMYDDRKPYTNHEIELQKGDSIYIFSDGYVDQFGGPKGKKFKAKPFKNLLCSIQDQPMNTQKKLIDEALLAWQGDIEQVDDICVIGVKV